MSVFLCVVCLSECDVPMCATMSLSVSRKSALNCFFQQLSQALRKISTSWQPYSLLNTTSSLVFLFESSTSPPSNWNDLSLQLNTMGTAISRFMKNSGPMKYQSIDSPQMKRNSAGHGWSSWRLREKPNWAGKRLKWPGSGYWQAALQGVIWRMGIQPGHIFHRQALQDLCGFNCPKGAAHVC